MNYDINLSYAVDSEEQGQRYPAIQCTDYEPRNLSAELDLCLSQDSLDLFSQDALQALGGLEALRVEHCSFGREQVQMFVLPSSVRWIILGKPRVFKYNKTTREYSELMRGDRMGKQENGDNFATATRLYMCCIANHTNKTNGDLLVDSEGNPQFFTLRLQSTKTKLLSAPREPGFSTIDSLNNAICKQHGLSRKFLAHLVSVGIKPVPEEFTSRNSQDSKLGCLFTFIPGAKELPDEVARKMFLLIQTEEVKGLLSDPFGVYSSSSPQSDHQHSGAGHEEAHPIPTDDIPF